MEFYHSIIVKIMLGILYIRCSFSYMKSILNKDTLSLSE